MIRLLLGALVLAMLGCIGLGGLAWWKHSALVESVAEVNGLKFALAGCKARQANIDKDRISDAEVDNMPDLLDVPPGWLMPEAGSGTVN